MILRFDDSARVFKAPAFLVPMLCWLVRECGTWWVFLAARYWPADRECIGLAVFGPNYCYYDSDRRDFCLFMRKDWHTFTVYKALTDLQRHGWNGITVDYPAGMNVNYTSPHLYERQLREHR